MTKGQKKFWGILLLLSGLCAPFNLGFKHPVNTIVTTVILFVIAYFLLKAGFKKEE